MKPMILRSLYELYERLSRDQDYGIPLSGYTQQNISFKVVINADASLHSIANLRDKVSRRPRKMIMPGADKPTGKITRQSVHKKVQFLRGGLPFLIGAALKGEESPFLSQSMMEFEAFKKYHLQKEVEINDPDYTLFCAFLRNWKPEEAIEHEDWQEFANGQGVFQILGKTEYLHDSLGVRTWLHSHQEIGQGEIGQCLVSGESKPIARLHEPKIKGVRGSQTAGAPIVAFDKDNDAFASYGRDGEQGLNAPVSEDAAFRYTTALNSLLVGPKSSKHRFMLADATVAFWTEESTNTEDIFAQFATHGSALFERREVQDEGLRQKVELFLKALREGKAAYAELDQAPDRTRFFILGLTGQAKGRLGVRFFYRDSISQLLDNLRRHHAHIGIERQYREDSKYPDPEFPAMWQMMDETCPRRNGMPDRERIPPVLSGPLLRAVITGSRYPEGLFNAVMRRIHADNTINYMRACIIKGYLTRNQRKEVSMGLDTNRKEPAYRLGRLFAALEKTQGDALGKVNATIRDRFFSSASATPGAVFPRLLRTYQHHLAKLEGGRKVAREKLVQEINWDLESFPAHLNLADQGLFAIGYYHQMKDLWTSRGQFEEEKEEMNNEPL
jgi:CRISPR-associated protein Csd1